MQKKSSHSAVIYTPGRWTGNNFFFKGGPRLPKSADRPVRCSQEHPHSDPGFTCYAQALLFLGPQIMTAAFRNVRLQIIRPKCVIPCDLLTTCSLLLEEVHYSLKSIM